MTARKDGPKIKFRVINVGLHVFYDETEYKENRSSSTLTVQE